MKFDANMSICFICEHSISEDEKPVRAIGRQTLLTASVTRGHSDHDKLLLSDETVRVHRKCQRSYADERTAAIAAKRKTSSEQRYLHVRNKCLYRH
jgi:hypothetical protein